METAVIDDSRYGKNDRYLIDQKLQICEIIKRHTDFVGIMTITICIAKKQSYVGVFFVLFLVIVR